MKEMLRKGYDVKAVLLIIAVLVFLIWLFTKTNTMGNILGGLIIGLAIYCFVRISR